MDINELINYITMNKPVLTVFILILWWFERNGRLSSEKRERGLLRELAECPPEPETESVVERIGVVSTTMALVAASALFLVGCGSMTYVPTKTPPASTHMATEAIETPTRIVTPPIIEVTASSEWQWDTIGVYTPSIMAMNIRRCSQVNDALCPVVGEVARGEPVTFYAIVVIHASGDVWLCLDPIEREGRLLSQCGKMVAQTLDNIPYGKIEIVEPPG